MKKFAAVLILIILISTLTFGERGPSTAEERARFIAFAHKYEANSTDPALVSDREWALKWLIEIPDVSVGVCSEPLSGVLKEKAKNDKGGLVAVYTIASAAFIIENPDKAKDQVAINMAAMKSMLMAYDAVVKTDPKAKLKSMEVWKQKQAEGTLDVYMDSLAKGCVKGT